ncbi:envelope integrity protein Cei [Pseudonocardia petroleophila]|uniref:Envelope integrity protein Cei n=1 Tax=Pseudonocardia petroleophila TaxID=37331 RepID=A0A7G7MD70_9PSEU|nr:envelope integrity protein Cei [Pseudonocardia petroleophila]QNG50731.1 envelope integrity protein Cei [Pseudonocardia petroleophila]
MTAVPYRRRRRTPIVAVVAVLAVIAAVTWTVVLVGASGPSGPQSCPTPAAGTAPGATLESGALDAVVPAPPAAIPVRVFNAGGQRGQANLVAAQLDDLGFGSAGPPDNDPFFPDGDMECVGQVRFGPAGESAASTLSLVLPCAELVRDERADDTVDVAVGTGFGDVNPPRPVRDVLETLGAPSPADDGEAGAPAAVDPAALTEARDTTPC